MTPWVKPSFEELTMNAEIGAYQPDDWDGERNYERFAERGLIVPSDIRCLASKQSPAPHA